MVRPQTPQRPRGTENEKNGTGVMNELRGFDIVFPREYLRAAIFVSLLSVWVLVGLFQYLNRYTKRY